MRAMVEKVGKAISIRPNVGGCTIIIPRKQSYGRARQVVMISPIEARALENALRMLRTGELSQR